MEGNPTPLASAGPQSRPITGLPGDRKIAAAVGQKKTIPGTSSAHDPTVKGPMIKSIPLRIVTQNLAKLSIRKKRPLDDLVDSVEACDISGGEPARATKKSCGGFCGGDSDAVGGLGEHSIDSEELVAMWMEGRAHSCYSVRNGLRAPPPSPIFVFDDTSSDTTSEDAGGNDASSDWETAEESGAGGEDEVRSSEGSEYSDCNDDSYEPSEASTDSDEGSEWDSDDFEGDLDYLNVGWWNNRMEAPTFNFVKQGIKGKAVGQIFPPIPPFVRCYLCLDTQLSILGLPIFEPIYRDDIQHLKPGVVLICGHMFCKACWTPYVEDYYDSIADRDDDDALEQIEGSSHEEDDMEMSYDDDPCSEEAEEGEGEAEDEEREEEEGDGEEEDIEENEEEEGGEEEEWEEEEEGEEEGGEEDDEVEEEGEQLPPACNGFFRSKDWNM
ncbi:hypothetical protein F5144DRAFT_654873 [Chaetomium tenue]|uniref:Uncharacterized protein n=1 Tax=Chaetomium tenue TaxID=1854479 RepID=A0ACB7P5F1_9PEZI|nr:hypothetical protein F5144DRAFT_654873 [Chaetomium globosum]